MRGLPGGNRGRNSFFGLILILLIGGWIGARSSSQKITPSVGPTVPLKVKNQRAARGVEDFGELRKGGLFASNAAANPIRGLFFGGSPSNTANIDLINIGSGGKAIYFGDMTVSKGYRNCMASPTRAVAAGGQTPGTTVVIDYVDEFIQDILIQYDQV